MKTRLWALKKPGLLRCEVDRRALGGLILTQYCVTSPNQLGWKDTIGPMGVGQGVGGGSGRGRLEVGDVRGERGSGC